MKKIFLTSVSVLCIYGANADESGVLCPPGCFCMNGGRSVDAQYSGEICASHSAQLEHWTGCIGSEYGGIWVMTSSSCNFDMPASYYFDEFSEFYDGQFGFYGFINNDFVYHNSQAQGFSNYRLYDLFECPLSHPHSASGASALTQCYKYDANGNKIYYGSNTNITCAEGTYLPANATQCVSCNASQNHVCPGGRFEKSDKIQGLKLNCGTGQYLPANATQCSACDESHYFCFGGIYDFNVTMDQGRIQHNGYVNMGAIHTFITCNPGQYVPANSTQCSACMGNYICPGGIFFTDSQYNFDRGTKICPYGQPNDLHTACVPKFSKPSLAQKPLNNTNVIKQKINSPITGQPTQEKTDNNLSVNKVEKVTKKTEKNDNIKIVKEIPEVAEKTTKTDDKKTIKEPLKITEKTVLEQKINDIKKINPSVNRSATQQPAINTESSDKKSVVSRTTKNASETNSGQPEQAHEDLSIKRPSRHK